MRYWNNGSIFRTWLFHEVESPLEIAFRKPSATEMLEHFDQVRSWIESLQNHDKTRCGQGYRLEFRRIHHRQMGEQQIPSRIYFEQYQDLLSFVKKREEFAILQQLSNQTRTVVTGLMCWLAGHPLKVLEYSHSWQQLLQVCSWFMAHPQPRRYLRELDIHGVDSKFIEQHKSILFELLNTILPENSMNMAISGLAQHGFERHFGLCYDEPLIRFRYLDKAARFSDLSVPVSQFIVHVPNVDTIFITENKINGLSFPAWPGAMVIFGLGYGVEMLKNAPWLQHKQLIYWGDIDTHGFAILAQFRSYFPEVKSLCMDEATLQSHRSLWVTESTGKRCLNVLHYLSKPEQQLLQNLQNNEYGENIRLEQERIRLSWVRKGLNDLLISDDRTVNE